ncbi:Uncharacterised protein [Mycoplasmopsis caviae]|uniref:Uncharacterized protein n=2 Tax=Mycoplasmopsis caviae TaxID=55603 RepID=A0A3P8LHY0_9BACT|nr:Uncharacterised protein [Mycoplasmopsis caviae]
MFSFKFSYYGLACSILIFLLFLIYCFVIRPIKFSRAKSRISSATSSAIYYAKAISEKNGKKYFLRFINSYFVPEFNNKKRIIYLDKFEGKNSIYFCCLCVFNSFLSKLFSSKYVSYEIIIRFVFFFLNINVIWLLIMNMWIIALCLIVLNLLIVLIVSLVNKKKLTKAIQATYEFLKWEFEDQSDFELVIKVLNQFKFKYLDLFFCSLTMPIVNLLNWFKNWGKSDE